MVPQSENSDNDIQVKNKCTHVCQLHTDHTNDKFYDKSFIEVRTTAYKLREY